MIYRKSSTRRQFIGMAITVGGAALCCRSVSAGASIDPPNNLELTPEAAKLVSFMDEKAGRIRVKTIDSCIRRLQKDGIWPKLKGLWLVGADEQVSTLNWKQPDSDRLQKVGAPRFLKNRFWQAIEPDQYLFTATKLDALMSRENFAHGGWSKTGDSQRQSDYGAIDDSFAGISLNARSLGGTPTGRMGQGLGRFGPGRDHYDGLGFHAIDRASPTEVSLYRNGVNKGSYLSRSHPLPALNPYFLTLNLNGQPSADFSNRRQSGWFISQSLSAAEHRCLYAAIADYLEAVEYGEPEIYDIGQNDEVVHADFVAYGATAQSILAALQAARAGLEVAICGGWRDRHYGGMSAAGLGFIDYDNHKSIGGLPRYVLTRINQLAGRKDTKFPFESSWFRCVMRELLDPATNGGYSIPLFWSDGVRTVRKDGAAIRYFETTDGRRFEARHYIDGSYEGDLLVAAGVSHDFGREAAGAGAERINGFRGFVQDEAGANHQFKSSDGRFLVHVDPWIKPSDPSSGLVKGVHGVWAKDDPSLNTAPALGSADRRLQAYNFRLTMTNDPAYRVPMSEKAPARYDVSRYELLLRYFKSNPNVSLGDILKIDPVGAGRVYDVNAKSGFSTDLFGENWNYAQASYAERELIWKDHWAFTEGLLYLLQHDVKETRVPQALRASALEWGWVQDHYLAPHPNDAIFESPQLYVREAFRMISDAVMDGNDVQAMDKTIPRISRKTIAAISYSMDSHATWRIAYECAPGQWSTWNEGNFEMWLAGNRTVPVSIEIVVPKASECTNLSSGFAVSATHAAFGAIRMEYTTMQIAQSMGMAAALAIRDETTIQNVDYAALRAALLASPRFAAERPPVLPQSE